MSKLTLEQAQDLFERMQALVPAPFFITGSFAPVIEDSGEVFYRIAFNVAQDPCEDCDEC